MSFVKGSCEHFVEILATKQPVPGGGGASALVGAVGIALGNMVGSLTLGKKKYAGVQDEVEILIKQANSLQEDLLGLVQKDAEAFEPLAKAYGMANSTPEEKAEKAKVLESCLGAACLVPLEIMEKCCAGILICQSFAEVGSKLAISDAGAGTTFCKAALEAASLNVFINTKVMKEADQAEEINKRAEKMLEEYGIIAAAVMEKVFAQIK
ncbi:MAG: cyclodeaminase/cyclohydrolase family protein [Anaerovoracaceae bacterium]